MIDSFIESAKGVVVSLCDLTGKFVEPWMNAGYSAILVDPQHLQTGERERESTHSPALFRKLSVN